MHAQLTGLQLTVATLKKKKRKFSNHITAANTNLQVYRSNDESVKTHTHDVVTCVTIPRLRTGKARMFLLTPPASAAH